MANLELYKIFVLVAREKNITKASEILNISQPAITKHIKNLENELNTVLFNRVRGMQLTQSGQQLYNKIFPAINVILDAEKEFETNRNINFGTYATMLSRVLSDCIAEFYKENKKSKITVTTEFFDSLFTKLQNYELDIIVGKKIEKELYDSSKIKYIKLGDAEFVFMINNKSKLKNKTIKVEDLKNKIIYIPRGVTASTEAFLNLIDRKEIKNEIKKIDSITMSQIIQNYDDCIGFVNKEYIEEEIENQKVSVLNIDFEIPSTEFGIYIHRDNIYPDLKELIKILKNKFASIT